MLHGKVVSVLLQSRSRSTAKTHLLHGKVECVTTNALLQSHKLHLLHSLYESCYNFR